MALLDSLRRFLGKGAGKADESGAGSDIPSPSPKPAGPAPQVNGSEVSPRPSGAQVANHAVRQLTTSLLGVKQCRRAPMQAAEQRIIERLERLSRNPTDPALVPRLPVVLPRVISLVRRDDASPAELAQTISRDPTLVADIVKIANSPRFRTSREIGNLQDAVLMLGQRGLVQLVISAAMRPVFGGTRGRFSQIGAATLWNVTERCAHACQGLCSEAEEPFHGYLAGMAINLGLMSAMRSLDSDYREARPPDTDGFHDALWSVSVRLAARVARHWEFHEEVCSAVAQCAKIGEHDSDSVLAGALRAAACASQLHVLNPSLSEAARNLLAAPERRAYEELQRVFGHAPEGVEA
jgi:HD-like signal output (HDOD) protein